MRASKPERINIREVTQLGDTSLVTEEEGQGNVARA